VVSRASLPVGLDVDVDEPLPEAVELATYFLVSEALTNVTKRAHVIGARAGHVGDGRLVVEVSDDGVGGASQAAGTGLSGLEDRVEALGGRLHVASAPGDGTRVRAEIPYVGALIDAGVTLQTP
jgi:signal transduction histidine kinase